MKSAFRVHLARAFALAALLPVVVAIPAAHAGTIEGRVVNARSGEYLERAQVSVEGSTLETFTDADGRFRLTGTPDGRIRLRVFFTGLRPAIEEISTAAGQVANQEIRLLPFDESPGTARDGVVKMSEYVVGASREMSATAIAINEQRFAPNITTVVTADEFGGVAEGNIAEVLKFLPGITVEANGGNLQFVSINGVSPENVPVTVNGLSLASAVGQNNNGRSAQLDLVSSNNLARVEILYSPTPESQGSSLAGSVNMVPRSSFERKKPLFTGSVFIMMRDEARNFRKQPGERAYPTSPVNPGFEFSYVAPVNDRFGFTLSAAHSAQYGEQDAITLTRRGTGTATSGAAFPHTTPQNPYLTAMQVGDSAKVTGRNSFGATVDYRLSPHDRLSFSFQASEMDVWFRTNNFNLSITQVRPGDFSATHTRGTGQIQLGRAERRRTNQTYMPTLLWRHDGSIWKIDTGLGYSSAQDENRGAREGFFRSTTSIRSGVTIAFEDQFYLRPRRILVTDTATGAPIDPHNLANHVLANGSDDQNMSRDTQRSAFANVRRDFPGRMPLSLKAGFDVRQWQRDLSGTNPSFTYVGRDGRTSTAPAAGDDSALPFFDPVMSQRIPPFGFPRTDGVSNLKVYEFSQTNPSAFVFDENAGYRASVNSSRYAEEIVSSAYLRGDLALPALGLKFVGGVRAEQTNIEAQGPLTDLTRNILRDAQGRPILGANGQPQRIATDALGISRLTFLERAARTDKEYLRYFPNLNAAYNVRENLIARAAVYTSIGRPNFNQYAGPVTLPDTDAPPSNNNRIVVNNVSIKPWTARTYNVRLEYYFGGIGQVSVGAFRRDFTNSFAGSTFTPSPEFLASYGLDAATYGRYDVSTQTNVEGTVRMTGLDFNYKQVLNFLPHWARGIQVFANGSAQRATGPNLGSFSGSNYIPRSASWGASLTREKFNLRVNTNYQGRQRRGAVTGNGIAPNTYNWIGKRSYVDVLAEYYLNRRVAVFANLRNVGSTTQDNEVYGPETPSEVQFQQRVDYGALWTFGLKGTF